MHNFIGNPKPQTINNYILQNYEAENTNLNNNLNNNYKNINNIENEDKNKQKKDKKDYLDYKNAFSKLKKFLQNQNLMFLCKTCNNYLFSNYSLEDVLIFQNKNINFIFNLESIFEEVEKQYNNELTIPQISNFFLTEKNILINEKIEFSNNENSCMDLIFHNLICKDCQNILGKYVIGVPRNLLNFHKKVFLDENKLITIKKEHGVLPEKVKFDEFILNDLIFQNIIKETNMQLKDTKDVMFNFHSFTNLLKYLKDIKKYLKTTIDDFEALNLYYNYLEYLKDKI